MCDDNHKNSNFVFGLLFGAILGAIVAVVIYKNKKEKVFSDLQTKLVDFFKSYVPKKKKTKVKKKVIVKKKPVILPKAILAATTPKPASPARKPKLFKKK